MNPKKSLEKKFKCNATMAVITLEEYEYVIKLQEQNKEMLEALTDAYESDCGKATCEGCVVFYNTCTMRAIKHAIESITGKKI